jgi:hypothetical protein
MIHTTGYVALVGQEDADKGYSIAQVREIAKQHHYKEISLNETSRGISFSKDNVRINVYYTTGTVGTCVNHPVRGKTQLFRRNLSPPELKQLFQNPRQHTGKGYYRKHAGHKWKNSQTGTFLSDFASRWEYVTEMTNSKADTAVLKKFMDEVYTLLFGTSKQAPRLNRNNPQALERCVLRFLVVKQAIQDGAKGVAAKDEISSVKPLSDYAAHINGSDATQMNRLAGLLRTLPKPVRVEVCAWIVGMLEEDHVLVNKKKKLCATDENVRLPHLEYSKFFYTKRQCQYLDLTYGVIMS